MGSLASANASCTNHSPRCFSAFFQVESRRKPARDLMPTPFKEDHQQFRQTVRQFCERELAPHVAEWERDELFPNWVFKRAGELGIIGAHYPEDVGGAGGDYWFSVAKSEELPRCLMAGVGMGLLVQSDMATPVIN